MITKLCCTLEYYCTISSAFKSIWFDFTIPTSYIAIYKVSLHNQALRITSIDVVSSKNQALCKYCIHGEQELCYIQFRVQLHMHIIMNMTRQLYTYSYHILTPSIDNSYIPLCVIHAIPKELDTTEI